MTVGAAGSQATSAFEARRMIIVEKVVLLAKNEKGVCSVVGLYPTGFLFSECHVCYQE